MFMPILVPAIALVLWSIIMLSWAVITRFIAVGDPSKLAKAPPGGRGVDLNGVLPARTMWKAHNYDHLMEQPTLFYPTVIILAILGHGSGINLTLAWTYVGLRVAHSLWQALVNTIPIRLALFATSSGVLAWLAINALSAALSA
jgi:hypothetical protein